jgi:hypothetical protein
MTIACIQISWHWLVHYGHLPVFPAMCLPTHNCDSVALWRCSDADVIVGN